MRLRNAVTSAKKINPLQILKDFKSPIGSSYISSAKKQLMNEEEYDNDDRIEFQLSGERVYNPSGYRDKENIMRNNNIPQVPKDIVREVSCCNTAL